MNVTAVEAFIDISGTRRGRVCQRPDGKFQFVTEALTGETEECLPYWRNEHPPSGIYERQVDAASALVATLQSAVRLGNIAATEFDLTVGPYPDLAQWQLWVEGGHFWFQHSLMSERPATILADLLQLARTYSGRDAHPDDRIYRDLNINGGDFLEFVVAVERHFGVDLSWVSPHDLKAEAQDPTIEALANDVLRQQP